MRYDAEMTLAQTIADYLNDVVYDPFRAASPIVTFFDPMSQDEANRIIVIVPSADTNVEDAATFMCEAEIGNKTILSQPTMQQDFADHYARVNAVRDKFYPTDLVSRLQAKAPDGFKINYVNPARKFVTQIGDYLYSALHLSIKCYVTANA